MNNITPIQELQYRWSRCRDFLGKYAPDAMGIILFSKLNIYYFSGTFVGGVLLIPLDGEPLLFCRRGIDRARIESPLEGIFQFNSYADIKKTLKDIGFNMPKKLAAEMNGLSWALSHTFTKHFADHSFVPGDKFIAMTRAGKSAWELEILRNAGAKHAKCLTELLPPFLHEGISELEVAHKISDLFFSEGHHGILRMGSSGEEIFFGYVSAGESGNYPSAFNGPVGHRGVHPAIPYMGSGEIKWQKRTHLLVDNCFTFAGYHTDKTQVYWLGSYDNIPPLIQDAHNFCIETQTRVAEQLRPGALPSEIWQQCMADAQSSKWNDGFMGLGNNKVNFVGHGIGLAIDEYPVLANGFDLPLEKGMVIAVEPKIGITGLGMVGVENTFEVTPHGGKSITGDDYKIICINRS